LLGGRVISWPDHEFRCEIYPERVYSLASPFGGMQYVKVGAEDFDGSYEIHSNCVADARALLTDAVRWQIEKLRRFLRNDDIFISISHGRILVKKPALIRSYEELDEFVQLALELYDQAMLTRSVGIEFVNENNAQPITEAICQVCGENISTEMVFCRRCKPPPPSRLLAILRLVHNLRLPGNPFRNPRHRHRPRRLAIR
jgi:hypothetical protein